MIDRAQAARTWSVIPAQRTRRHHPDVRQGLDDLGASSGATQSEGLEPVHSDKVLRVKGLLNVSDALGPVILQWCAARDLPACAP